MAKTTDPYVKRWNRWLRPVPGVSHVYELQTGGYLAGKLVPDPRTGRRRLLTRVFREGTAAEAAHWLAEQTDLVQGGESPKAAPKRMRFRDFAASLLETKVAAGDIKSAKTRERWFYSLRRLFAHFGAMYVDQIRYSDVAVWRETLAKSLNRTGERVRGSISPTTANDDMRLLRDVLTEAVRRYELKKHPMEGIKPFDDSDCLTYTEEEPNSLTPDELAAFLAKMRELYPQHFAMVALGFYTGLRPSSLRPLRRRGAEVDLIWATSQLRVRRSNPLKAEVMNTTKTRRHQTLHLSDEMMRILREHVKQLPEAVLVKSDLLFPSEVAGFRSRSALDKPFRVVAKAIGLKKHVSPRAMRRTFQDLARAAHVDPLVKRSISGHATEKMADHYATVAGVEQRAAMARMMGLVAERTNGKRSAGEPPEHAKPTEVLSTSASPPSDEL